MSEPLEGELVRHHDKPFYAQQSAPRFFWLGCLSPILVVAMISFFIYKGATSAPGSDFIRGVVIFVFAFLGLQLIFGGGLFFRNKSSLARGILASAVVVLVIIMVALIGAASIIGSFLK